MFSESILAANLAALERAQGRRPLLGALNPDRVRALPDAVSGLRLEISTSSGDWLPLEGPVAAQYPQPFPKQLFVIGPALGAVLDAIEGVGAPTRVVALEPDPGVAVLMLARRDWTQWIEQGRLRLLTGPDYGGAANCAKWVDVSDPPVVLVCPRLVDHRVEDVAAARAVATRLIADSEMNASARKRFAGRYLLNSLANLPVIGRESNAAALDGLFRNRPAVIVGAGPSLDGNLPALAALQERAVIIGADTTLRPLLAGGVRPHIMAGVDPAPLNAQHLAGVEGLADIWLAAEGSLDPAAFGGFEGRTFVFKVSDHEPWPWLRAAGCDRGLLRAWGSVVTSAFDLALRMGCDPIIFAGLDLSYPVRRPYCRNTIFDRTWHDAIETYGCTWEALLDDFFGRIGDLHRPDLAGVPVLTSPHLVSFRNWLVEQTAGETSRRFINATGAGILHGRGITQSTLHDALGGAPAIDRDVRDNLRSAHADGLVDGRRVAAAVAQLLADTDEPQAAAQIARWVDFTAGSVTAADIRDRLGEPSNSLDK
jgi:hypothetical protein